MQCRIAEVRDSGSDIYSSVDVRAWPLICKLLSLSADLLSSEALCREIQLQMCEEGTTRLAKYQWLRGAADLLDKLGLQVQFDEAAAFRERSVLEPGIYLTFNSTMLTVKEREDVLKAALKRAPQTLIRKVLSRLDEDVDEQRKEKYEDKLRMLHSLLEKLDQDIRTCCKAFFMLKWQMDCVPCHRERRAGTSAGLRSHRGRPKLRGAPKICSEPVAIQRPSRRPHV